MSHEMTAIFENAPAKINLTLEILGRRADGYHELRSLVVFAHTCADRVSLDLSKAPGVSVSGPFGATIEGANLLSKVLALLRENEPRLRLGAIALVKNLPVASGIGGGSADAAAALRLIRGANPELAGALDWAALAARVGADVPVCLESAPSLMSGVGDVTEPVAVFPRLAGVLVNPLVAVAADKTARVFRQLGAPALAAPVVRPPVPVLASLDAVLGYMLVRPNGLSGAAIEVVPEIAIVLAQVAALPGCRIARLSGAGPTCFGLFDTFDQARAAAGQLSAGRPDWWIKPARLG